MLGEPQKTLRTRISRTLAYLIMLLLISACDSALKAAPSKKLKRVEAVTVKAESFREKILLSSVARAVEEHQISAEIRGRIKALHIKRGDQVKKGALLFEIDPEPFLLRLQEGKALLARASARLKFTRSEVKRKQPLFEEGRLSRSAWEHLKLEAEIAQTEWDQGIASQSKTKRLLRLSRLNSPMDGLVLESEAELGGVVSEGMLLARLGDLSFIIFELGVSDREIGSLHKKDRVSITIDAFPGKTFEGEISRIAGNTSPEKGTFPVEVVLKNQGGEILPGMLGRLSLSGAEFKNQILIPLTALHQKENRSFIYLIEKDRILERQVRSGLIMRDRVLIEEGLSEGDRLVLISQGRLEEGERVEVLGTP